MMNQNQYIFEYCNLGQGYLKIVVPLNDTVFKSKEIFIDLCDYQIENGVITQIDALVFKINNEMQKLGVSSLPPITLLIRCYETYHTVLTIPGKNHLQARYLYNKMIKTKVNKDIYKTCSNSYKNEDGYTFNTYFVSKNIASSFSRIAKRLDTKISRINPFGMTLCDSLKHEGNYVYFYIMKKTCTMILVSDMKLITSYDFEFDDSKTIINMFLLIASKHEFEYNCHPITHYGLNADEDIGLNLGLTKL